LNPKLRKPLIAGNWKMYKTIAENFGVRLPHGKSFLASLLANQSAARP